jgi:hypothetical protein
VDRQQFGPVDLRRWAGAFHDPRQNVKRSVEMIGQCPFIPRRMPIHGLVIDIGTGGIEVLVDGGVELARRASPGTRIPAVPAAAGITTPAMVPEVSELPGSAPPAAGKAAAAPPAVPTSTPTGPQAARAPVNIPASTVPPKQADGVARPIPNDLLGSLQVLLQAYAEMKNRNEFRAEAEKIRARVAKGESLLEVLDWIELNVRRLSSERPDIIAALRIVREHVDRSPAGAHLQKLLNQIL